MTAGQREPRRNSAPPRTAARLASSLVGLGTMGYGASLVVHLILLASLSVVILEQSGETGLDALWSTIGSDGGGGSGSNAENASGVGDLTENTVVDEIETGELASQSPALPLIEMPAPKVAAISPPEIPFTAPQPGLSPTGVGSAGGGNGGTGEGGREGEFGGGFEYAIPKNGRAVIRGNFAAWTVPQDPKPKEPYKIVIQIKLPKNVKSYPLTDLSGMVEGTDQYKQAIPQSIRGVLPVVDSQTQFVVEVPGANALVKDTIVIRSRILSESQKLEIVF